jgi:glycosyltransferase involved in cell wall biosynthesis
MPYPRILFITAFPPYPPISGDRQRSNLIYRALSGVGRTDIFLASIYSRPYPEMLETLKKDYNLVAHAETAPAGERGLFKPFRKLSPSLVDRLAGGLGRFAGAEYSPDPAVAEALANLLARNRYDVLVGRYLRTTARSGALAYTPLVIDVDDYDPQVYRDRLAGNHLSMPVRLMTRRLLSTVERIVPERLAPAEHLWLAASRDLPEIKRPNVSVLPNLAFFAAGQGEPAPLPPAEESKTIITVGNYGAKMNEKGVDRFVTLVWPKIRAAEPEAVFRIIGANLSETMQNRWARTPGVEPVGFVEDLKYEYARCAFTVAPIYEGGGTKIKVLESLHNGRTVALPGHSLRGYEQALRHGESVWVAADDDKADPSRTDAALADGCVALLRDPAMRWKMAEEGIRQLKTFFSFPAFQAEVESTIRRVTEGSAGVRLRSPRQEEERRTIPSRQPSAVQARTP